MFTNTPFGFSMQYPNGWIISVQWGPGNYCETRHQYNGVVNPFDGAHHQYDSRTAEIAVMHVNHKGFYPLAEHDDVLGWQTVEQVQEWMQWVSQLDRHYPKVMAEAPYKGLNVGNTYDDDAITNYHDDIIATFKIL